MKRTIRDETLRNRRSPVVLQVLLMKQSVASVVHAKVLGTEHVLYAILHDGNALATRILRGLVFLMKTRKIRSRLLPFVEI